MSITQSSNAFLVAFILASGLSACGGSSGGSDSGSEPEPNPVPPEAGPPPLVDAEDLIEKNQRLAVDSNDEIDGVWFYAGTGEGEYLESNSGENAFSAGGEYKDGRYGVLEVTTPPVADGEEAMFISLRYCGDRSENFQRIDEFRFELNESDGQVVSLEFNADKTGFTYKAVKNVETLNENVSVKSEYAGELKGLKLDHGLRNDYQLDQGFTINQAVQNGSEVISNLAVSMYCYEYLAGESEQHYQAAGEEKVVYEEVSNRWLLKGKASEEPFVSLSYSSEDYSYLSGVDLPDVNNEYASLNARALEGSLSFSDNDQYETSLSIKNDFLLGTMNVTDDEASEDSMKVTFTQPSDN